MPLDGPITDYTTVAEPSLKHFATWLEGEVARRGAETGYDYNAQCECLCAQYFEFLCRPTGGLDQMKAENILGQTVLLTKPWTLGAALTRARKALAEQEG